MLKPLSHVLTGQLANVREGVKEGRGRECKRKGGVGEGKTRRWWWW